MANANAGYIGNRFSDIEHQEANIEQFPEITAPSGNPGSNKGWLYVKDSGGASNLYFESDDGTVTDLLPAGSTKWDDIGNPDGANAIDMTTYASVFDWGGTADMMTHEFTANFGNVSGMVLEQKTGNPTDGTIFEIKIADTDPDFLSFATSGVEKVNINDSGDITLSAGDLSCVDITGSGNLSIAGTWEVDAIAATTATQTLTLDGDTTGGVTIGATSTGNVTLGDDVVVSDTYNVTIGEGQLVIDDDQNEIALTITSAATSALGGAIGIDSDATTGNVIHVVADDLTSGAMINLESSATGLTTGSYLQCYDGAANDFEIGLYGATVIAGNASTDILTITAGDVEITAGDVDVNNGNLMVDTVQDIAHNISRNYAGAGSAAALTVNEDNTSSTSVALAVNNDGTGNSTGVQISHDGDLPSLEIVAGAARTGNVVDIAMANQLAQNGVLVDGAWTGASDIGMINLNPSGNIAAGASALRIDTDTGTPAGSGFGIEVDDDSLAGGGYAVLINSTNNGGLHVEAGASLFAALASFTAGINSDAGIDADFAANTETVNVTADVADYASGTGIVTVYDDSTGQTNASYLLRLAREADGDAQDYFILCQDNSTGAAANGDAQFAVNSGGDVVMGGASGTGGRLQYSFEDLTIASAGTAASVEVVTSFITTNGDADEDNATLADGIQGQVKIFAIAVEGAGGDTWKITPANLNGGSKISFDGVIGDGCTMLFDGTSWNIISNNGGTIS